MGAFIRPNNTMSLRILACGGTFDKHYDMLTGRLDFAESHLSQAVQRARITLPTTIEIVKLMDSLEMQDSDRSQVLASCVAASETAVVIVHGTDTMPETAAVLGAASLAKTIVLTGAMIPYEIADSDALFNLGLACGVAQTLPAGVYIAMNGQIFDWNHVKKDRQAGVFVSN